MPIVQVKVKICSLSCDRIRNGWLNVHRVENLPQLSSHTDWNIWISSLEWRRSGSLHYWRPRQELLAHFFSQEKNYSQWCGRVQYPCASSMNTNRNTGVSRERLWEFCFSYSDPWTIQWKYCTEECDLECKITKNTGPGVNGEGADTRQVAEVTRIECKRIGGGGHGDGDTCNTQRGADDMFDCDVFFRICQLIYLNRVDNYKLIKMIWLRNSCKWMFSRSCYHLHR